MIIFSNNTLNELNTPSLLQNCGEKEP